MSGKKLSEVFGANARLDNGVLTIDFSKDFGITPNTPEQCLAALLWKLHTDYSQATPGIEVDSGLMVSYQGQSSSTNLATNMQENFDRFEVTFIKVTPVASFNPSDY